MCGILVTSGASQRPFHHRLLNGLRKRGPDSIGFWSDGRTNMAHTRLAIVGLDDRGIEPLENESHVLAYNGEIYNFLDLSRKLAAEGSRITFANDAEEALPRPRPARNKAALLLEDRGRTGRLVVAGHPSRRGRTDAGARLPG